MDGRLRTPTRRSARVDGVPALHIDGDVAVLRLERPAEHNRIDPDDIPLLRAHLKTVLRTRDVRALVITGSGTRTFSSGYTVDAIADRLDRGFEDLLDSIEHFPLPTLCALNGSVYGGATDLALCCDFRIGVRGSRMFMPSARFGLHYYPGGLRRYVGLLGAAQAKRLFLTAQTIDADEMLRIGFLTELVPKKALTATIEAYLDAIRACNADVVRSMKKQIDRIAGGDREAAQSRTAYERSLRSPALRMRLAALRSRR
ncbi:MAG TPA: enoyl-CoA hydratase/isomerase family protein [Casimicrobiaceae bacterium]